MPREDLPILNFSNELHWRTFMAYIATYKGKGNHRVEITRVRNQHSVEQRGYYYGVVLPCIAKAFAANEGFDSPDLHGSHQRLKDMLIRRPHVRRDTGEITGWYTPSFADLDVPECSAFIDKAIAFARDELMVHVPPPEDYRNEKPEPKRKIA